MSDRETAVLSALEQVSGFLGAYSIAGLVLIFVLSAILGPSEIGDLTGIFVGVHLISAVVLCPSASMTAFFVGKYTGPASWPRLWVTGALAAPVVWIGTLMGGQLTEPVLREMASPLGWWGGLLNYYCWAVLSSNLVLLIAYVMGLRKATR